MQVTSEAQAEGAVNREQVKMLESVISFGDLRAGAVMTPRTDIFALPAETTIEEARRAAEAEHALANAA